MCSQNLYLVPFACLVFSKVSVYMTKFGNGNLGKDVFLKIKTRLGIQTLLQKVSLFDILQYLIKTWQKINQFTHGTSKENHGLKCNFCVKLT